VGFCCEFEAEGCATLDSAGFVGAVAGFAWVSGIFAEVGAVMAFGLPRLCAV